MKKRRDSIKILSALALALMMALMPLSALMEASDASGDPGVQPGESIEDASVEQADSPEEESDESAEQPIRDTYDPAHPENLADENLLGEACVVIDRVRGDVLYDKNATARMFPASTTKIMTLLLAVEHGGFDDTVEIPQDAKNVPSDSSKVPVLPGERMSFDALLHGMMLKSGNDAANAVAVIVGGSVSAFVERMNQRAAELGCEDTHFVNAHGYHDINHYTTALDMAKIASAGMKNAKFREIAGAMYYTMPVTLQRNTVIDLTNPNPMLFGTSEFYDSDIQGIKSGYHSAAGNCYVSAAIRDGVSLVAVTFKSTVDGRWIDTRRLMDYGFAQYQQMSFAQMYEENPIEVTITGARPDDPMAGKMPLDLAPGGALNDYTTRLRPENTASTLALILDNSQIEYTHPLEAPIRAGTEVGTITAKYADGTALTATLLATRDVDAPALTEEIIAPEPEIQPEPASEPSWVQRLLDSEQMRLIIICAAVLALLIGGLVIAYVQIKRERERERERLRRRSAARRRRAARQNRDGYMDT